MSATRDLIAAALTAADVFELSARFEDEKNAVEALREACTRTMTAQQRASDADMQVYQAIADGYARDTQRVSAAEVPMPEPSHESVVLEDGLYKINSRMYDENKMRTYGDDREAAGYARGLNVAITLCEGMDTINSENQKRFKERVLTARAGR